MPKIATVCNELSILKEHLHRCNVSKRELLAIGLCLSCQAEVKTSTSQPSASEELKFTYVRMLMGFPIYTTTDNCFSCKLQ